MINKTKKRFFNIVIILFVPVLLLLTEVSFRIFGVGYDTRPFMQSATIPESYIDNPTYYWKYYPDYQGRIKIEPRNIFAQKKDKNILRGFVIGESTAEGFPFNSNQSFSQILQNALQSGLQNRKIEIVNSGLSAMTSYYTRDQAMKILDYQPDFLVLYGGHNEIYGTVSLSTGGNYLFDNFYLFLKEFRIFQVLYNALGTKSGDSPNNHTLMANQFNQKHFELNPQADSQVADTFIRNMEYLIHEYNKRNIPVILVEPVSNLVDMPPFAGKGDDDFKDFIAEYLKIINGSNTRAATDFYSNRQKHHEFDNNANILFLDAQYQRKFLNTTNIDLFIKAKDNDVIPFRARSATIRRLRDFYQHNQEKYPALHYLPTYDLINDSLGPDAFGKKLFIDQLHFNFDGQVFLAKAIADETGRLFKFTDTEKTTISGYFADPTRIKSDISLLPYYEVGAYSTIMNMVDDEPFKSAKIPFEPGSMDEYFPHNIFYEDKVLWQKCLSSYGSSAFMDDILKGLYDKQDYQGILNYRLASVKILPAKALYHMNLAKALSAFDDKQNEALSEVVMAYRLSGRSQEYYKELQGFLEFSKQPDRLKQISDEYGSPNKN